MDWGIKIEGFKLYRFNTCNEMTAYRRGVKDANKKATTIEYYYGKDEVLMELIQKYLPQIRIENP